MFENEGMSRPIRIAAVDDHEIVLTGLAALAATQPEAVAMVVRAQTATELLAKVNADNVDVALLDLHLGDGSDPEATVAELTRRGVKVLIYTTETRPVPLRRALKAGARGIALKHDPAATLINALREVAAGEFAASSELAYVLATDDDLVAHLAPRELEALQLLASGLPKKAVGHRMTPPVEANTVTTYFSRIAQRYADLGRAVGNTYGTIREASKDGYIDIADEQPRKPAARDRRR